MTSSSGPWYVLVSFLYSLAAVLQAMAFQLICAPFNWSCGELKNDVVCARACMRACMRYAPLSWLFSSSLQKVAMNVCRVSLSMLTLK